MAFVTRTARTLSHQVPTTGEHVGPGTYNQFSSSTRSRPWTWHGAAPFCSRAPRTVLAGDERTKVGPGPGEYSISGRIGEPKAGRSIPTAPRFVSLERGTPGPGSYSPICLWTQKQRRKDVSRHGSGSGVRKSLKAPPTVPSIMDDRRLIGDLRERIASATSAPQPITAHDRSLFVAEAATPAHVGPGSYELGPPASTKIGISFDRSSERLSDPKLRAPGPGAYNLLETPKPSKILRDPERHTSSFMGGKDRFIEKPNANPGPGTYEAREPQWVSWPVIQTSFGGSERRSTWTRGETPTPGPGSYLETSGQGIACRPIDPALRPIFYPKTVPQRDRRDPAEYPFDTSAPRFLRERVQEGPGPGEYDLAKPIAPSDGEGGRNPPFGSSQTRDVVTRHVTTSTQNITPGPGTYSLNEVPNASIHYKGRAAFASTGRDLYVGKKSEGPGPTDYQPCILRDIHKVRKATDSIPFGTNDPRRTTPGVDAQGPGPGAYTLRPDTTAPTPSKYFIAKARRFPRRASSNKNVPGPGAYHVETTLVRPSFNRTIRTVPAM
eukprot:TRINITY_DN27572_c0_g1_i1.p1 TRINITY_DN27572_c0_g1~~TRINITY_DN27572_c0_g1_i1.p1  ORF type:complete len:583 (+),score=48.88 TRINITY_DN27572_c0_g1_i1:97-1749(+)